MRDPTIRIVSLTVTEGGYFIDPATGAFDVNHPAIQADIASPDRPGTVFGLILAALSARREAGTAPFTVLSCDNVPHNGVIARNAVAGLAESIDPGFAAWVRAEVAFPNGMVDRIATATGDRERGMCRDVFGVDDAWPVFCEDYIQWVVEDRFPQGRPALEEAGVTFVPDVTPFEHMKIRILNGGHAIIAYPAGLMDIHFVHEAMETPLIRAFLAKLEREEIIPVLPPVPGVDLGDYFAADRAALRQPQDRRHRAPALPRRLEPAAEVHRADHRRPPGAGPRRDRPRARIGALVPLLRRRHRQRRDHRAERPELGPAAGAGPRRQGRPRRLARHGGHLRRRRGGAARSATPSRPA